MNSASLGPWQAWVIAGVLATAVALLIGRGLAGSWEVAQAIGTGIAVGVGVLVGTALRNRRR
jgi:hypothetical protein